MKSITRIAVAALFFVLTQSHALLAQSSLAGETLRITRTTGSIKIDGNLSDEAWQAVKPVTTWYEVNPGDNTPPKLRNVGRIAYDDRFLYAAFEFDDRIPPRFGRRIQIGTTPAWGSTILAESSSTRATAVTPPDCSS